MAAFCFRFGRTRLWPALKSAGFWLYAHPSLDRFMREFAALVSSRVGAEIKKLGIEFIRHQDL